MRLIITLKETKKQGFTLSLEDTFLEKPGRGVKLTTPYFCESQKFIKKQVNYSLIGVSAPNKSFPESRSEFFNLKVYGIVRSFSY